MLQNLSEQARECLRRADHCAEQAKWEPNPSLKREFLEMEDRWRQLANNYQFLERLGLFTAHNKRRRAELSLRLEQLNELLKNGKFTATSRANSLLEAHAAKVAASDPLSSRLVAVCATAGVQLLHYPVSAERQVAGQTMAVGAISRCLKQYGEDTLITALQCVTQTTNNKPGALTARIIKALCALLAQDLALRDSGLALLERFDRVDLIALSNEATAEAAAKKIDAVQALVARLRQDINAPIAEPMVSDSDHYTSLAPDVPGFEG